MFDSGRDYRKFGWIMDCEGSSITMKPMPQIGVITNTIGKLVPAKSGTELKQGYIENSTTQPVTEMMDLIESSRAFEANINMIKHQDDALGRLLGSLPRH